MSPSYAAQCLSPALSSQLKRFTGDGFFDPAKTWTFADEVRGELPPHHAGSACYRLCRLGLLEARTDPKNLARSQYRVAPFGLVVLRLLTDSAI